MLVGCGKAQFKSLIQTRNIRTTLRLGSRTSVPILRMHFSKTNISLKIKKKKKSWSCLTTMLKQVPPTFFNSAKTVATTKRLEKAFIQCKQYQYSTNSTSGRCSKQAEIQSYVSRKPRCASCWKGKAPPRAPLWAGDILTLNSLAMAMVRCIHRWHQVVLVPQTEACKVVKDDHVHSAEHASCISVS